ncbi:cobalt-zinc-cadmium resistance protein CzcC precursor [mine drainage metagenome]|uniref:Cobalt-zinc-cadmium resistance protein CzcC n=1 Tax=mine drainage metagenome TaxID=410659 RepID=A0A1J5SWU1_9ZZZZ
MALLLPSLVIAADNVPETALIGTNVQELLQWADTHNPEISAMRYEVDAANERIVPAGALPDPILRTELRDFAGPGAPGGFNPLPGKGNGTKYTLMQSFPLWGKRDVRKEVATAELAQVKGRRQVTVAEIHAQIKSAYAQYYLTFGLKKLNDEILHLLSDLEAISQARYANGLAPQQDVIRAQIEKTALRSENINLDTEQHHAMTRLNTALARPQNMRLAEPSELRHIAPEELDSSILHDKMLRNNPWLAAQSAQISVAEANKRLVEKNRYPDITLGIAPIQRGGSIDSWEAMVEFNIPIRLYTRHAQENEAGAMLDAAKERQQAVANQADGELQELLASYASADRQEQLITSTLLPQAELTFHSALTGYETGKVDFATLLDAQRAIKRAKEDKLKAQVEQELRISDIEKVVGEEL